MRSSRILASLGFLSVLSGACADMGSPTQSTGSGVQTANSRSSIYSAAPSAGEADALAHAFALALARPEVRIEVRNAMRASRVTEHKLVLRDFVATAAGRRLLQAAASATGTSEESMLQRVWDLPPLDFYAPYRQHRRSWRATPDVQVGAMHGGGQVVMTLYSTSGSETQLRQGDSHPAPPVLFLAPAETKSERIAAQPDSPGEVIQDASDGELSGTYEWVGRGGKTHVISLAALRRHEGARGGPRNSDGIASTTMDAGTSCDPQTAVVECAGDGTGSGGGSLVVGGGVPNNTTTRVSFETSEIDPFATSVEIELRTGYWENGVRVAQKTLRFEGVVQGEPYGGALYDRVIPSVGADYIRINVYETDWLDGDDLGTRNFFWDDYGEFRSIVDNGSVVQLQTVTNVKIYKW